MTNRTNPFTRMDLVQPFIDYSNSVPDVGLEPTIKELVKIRASQINGCARCLVMHTEEARQLGESEMRIYLLDAWREAPHFTPRERAAIAWTEALTRLSHDNDAAYALIEAEFTEAERIALTLLIGNINTWNRINVGFQVKPPRSSAIAVAA